MPFPCAVPPPAIVQPPSRPSSLPLLEHQEPGDGWAFLAGALSGLLIHEAGHVAAGTALDLKPRTTGVHGGGAAFFAVTYGRPYTPHRNWIISSSGFWAQNAMAETILTRTPNLRHQRAPFRKGAFAFHLATCLVYAYGALAKSGPAARDTTGIEAGGGYHERMAGAAILAVGLLDATRYWKPDSPLATWTSRGLKVSFVVKIGR